MRGDRHGERVPVHLKSGSEAGSYSRLIDLLYHSTLGLRVIKKKKYTWGTVSVLVGEKYLLPSHRASFDFSGPAFSVLETQPNKSTQYLERCVASL